MPGPTPQQRQANLEDLIREMYVLYDAGAVTHFEHLVEPHRQGDGTIDLIVATLGDGTQVRMTYGQSRLFLRGYQLAVATGAAGRARTEVAVSEPPG